MQHDAPENIPRSNIPEMSVSELATSLKRTLEDTYGHIRIRGELSRVKIHTSGHMYSDLKDENAVLNVVCWRGTLSKLSVKPEEGLEVICTGRISSYPARSNYQMIIESMELAGEGALLKLLEERKKKLAAEGLFDPARKKPLPYLPEKIGVITSPTGAVIRDIMHRLADRCPRHVLLWPVRVQGDTAADEVTNAINGFNALPNEQRPDLLIVARGGGSLEDLMAFNEENVVRAAANSTIPIISAIGHETDTTLIDYASDKRAPTPTGAAEIAVPRRLDILAWLDEAQQRSMKALQRYINDLNNKIAAQTAKLDRPERLLEIKSQNLDHTAHKLNNLFERTLTAKLNRTAQASARLRHPKSLIDEKSRTLGYAGDRLTRLKQTLLKEQKNRLSHAEKMLKAFSFEDILQRGFVVVWDETGKPVTNPEKTKTGQLLNLQFKNNQNLAAKVDKNGPKSPKTPAKPSPNNDQANLF